jgi:hypothetical protein
LSSILERISAIAVKLKNYCEKYKNYCKIFINNNFLYQIKEIFNFILLRSMIDNSAKTKSSLKFGSILLYKKSTI